MKYWRWSDDVKQFIFYNFAEPVACIKSELDSKGDRIWTGYVKLKNNELFVTKSSTEMNDLFKIIENFVGEML